MTTALVRLAPCVECCCSIPEDAVICPECGEEAARATRTCPECDGTGKTERAVAIRTLYGYRTGPTSPTESTECEACGGWGEIEPPYVAHRDRARAPFAAEACL